MRMSSIYGADRWERAYGATMPPAWRHRLGLRTLAELAQGVALAERDDSGRLPTLGILATMCRQYPHGQRTPQEPARQQLGDLRSMAERTAVGRAWAAYWQLEGLVPRTMSEEEIEERLENADLDAMRAQVARERQRNPYGGSPHG